MEKSDPRLALIETEFKTKKNQCTILLSFYKEFWNITKMYFKSLKKLGPLVHSLTEKFPPTERP